MESRSYDGKKLFPKMNVTMKGYWLIAFVVLLFFAASEIRLLSGSCHLDRASNVEISVECHIFFIVIFFNCSHVLQFGLMKLIF